MDPHAAQPTPAHRPSRRVVYSALLGRYENLREQPVALASGVPFILFTDDPDLRSSTWDVRVIEPSLVDDAIRSARSLKIRGHEVIDEYDESLWIDNRVELSVDPSVVLDAWLAEADVAIFEHSFRDRLIDEFSAVVAGGYDDPSRVYEQFTHYAETRPELLDSKPLWTGMIARRKTPNVAFSMSQWWTEVEERSRRDQLSAPVLYSELGSSLAVITSASNEHSDLHEWPPISSALGRNHIPVSDPSAVKPSLLRLREAEVAQSDLRRRIDGLEAEAAEWEQKVRYRDEAIRHLQGDTDLLRADSEHRARVARDTIISLQEQLASEAEQLVALRTTHRDVSEGFAKALGLLQDRKRRATAQRRKIHRLRQNLTEAEAANQRLHDEVENGARVLSELHKSATWKVARRLSGPSRMFGLGGKKKSRGADRG